MIFECIGDHQLEWFLAGCGGGGGCSAGLATAMMLSPLAATTCGRDSSVSWNKSNKMFINHFYMVLCLIIIIITIVIIIIILLSCVCVYSDCITIVIIIIIILNIIITE